MMDERLERVAAAEHEQWMRWAQTLMDTEALSQERIDRWKPYMVPYSELPDDVQEYDRIEARKAITAFLGGDEVYVVDLSNERQVDEYQFGRYLMTLKRRKILVPLNREDS